MLVVIKKNTSETELEQIKQYLIDQDFDFHQSTGDNRVILGIIGNTGNFDTTNLEAMIGVHVVFKIPAEE
ncbi:MAG: hypothetical protein B6I36_05485 [Desulfobacteraceae bacterium 4572_35.1]|nr:MAG: hypothetical protein B6I36_05485 [Desulfobacteraceae bacterium 4572_35.1]